MNRSWMTRLMALLLTIAPAAAMAEVVVIPVTDAAKPTSVLNLPATPFRYANIDLPAHFKTPAARRFDNMPRGNPVTDAGATLGRVLFYDTRLSANGTVACASCHQQQFAFVDPQRFSAGFEGARGDRHSMSLVELRYYPPGKFFWDERAATLEDQVLMPIQSVSEMGQNLPMLVKVVASDANYAPLFKAAFGDSTVTSEHIARALAQFVRSMVSYQSRYDEGRATSRSVREDFASFTPEENRGKATFLRDCAACHMPGGQDAHFQMLQPKDNGLDPDLRVRDAGVGDVTLNANEMGLFKSPSLRNVDFTGPYMHDGRFNTLEAVMGFYARGGLPHPNRSREMRRFNLGPQQRDELVAFLKTLSDNKFVTDPKFANPFVKPPVGTEPSTAPKGGPLFAVADIGRPFFGPPNGRGRGFGPQQGGRGAAFNPSGGNRGPGVQPAPGGRGAIPARITVDDVVARIMRYDRGKDGLLTQIDIPERMRRLFMIGDTNHDGMLDQDEIKTLASKNTQPVFNQGPGFRPGPPPRPPAPPARND